MYTPELSLTFICSIIIKQQLQKVFLNILGILSFYFQFFLNARPLDSHTAYTENRHCW